MRSIRVLTVTGLSAVLAAACGGSGSTGFGDLPDGGVTGLPDIGTTRPDVFKLPPLPDGSLHDSGTKDGAKDGAKDTGKSDGSHPGSDGSSDDGGGGDGGTTPPSEGGTPDGATHDGAVDAAQDTTPPPPPCNNVCSPDFTTINDCNGNVVTTCSAGTACDITNVTCESACTAAENDHISAGCDFYATYMDTYEQGVCFAAFVANTWTSPAHLTVDLAGAPLTVANFAYTPSGSGTSITYTPYDPAAGIAPGSMAILFLAASAGSEVPCPKMAATDPTVTESQVFNTSGIGASFHITTDVPVASYQINPYGGGSAAVTGASLLLPTSVWNEQYIAVTVAPEDISPPSMNIIASQDNTQVTITPNVAIAGGGTLPAAPAGSAPPPAMATFGMMVTCVLSCDAMMFIDGGSMSCGETVTPTYAVFQTVVGKRSDAPVTAAAPPP